MSEFSPVVAKQVPQGADMYLLKYANASCIVYDYNGNLYLPADTNVGKLVSNNFVRSHDWLLPMRNKHTYKTDKGVFEVTDNLLFKEPYQVALFIYGNKVDNKAVIFKEIPSCYSFVDMPFDDDGMLIGDEVLNMIFLQENKPVEEERKVSSVFCEDSKGDTEFKQCIELVMETLRPTLSKLTISERIELAKCIYQEAKETIQNTRG